MDHLKFNQSISQLIKTRYSCRTYQARPISDIDLASLEEFINTCHLGPFGTQSRFKIVAAKEGDNQSLKGLGTYGFIKNPTGFIIGACRDNPGSLEDFGYLMEAILLRATDLGLGSCWLGGTFTKSRFSRVMELNEGEFIPAVVSIGYPADEPFWLEKTIRIRARADYRLDWEDLFFYQTYGVPLKPSEAGKFQEPLEMVRLAPSASNKQPWRIVKKGKAWYFFLRRTANYPNPVFDYLLNLADLQRVDLGIAMSHFELSARERNLSGNWVKENPNIPQTDSLTEYTATWQIIN